MFVDDKISEGISFPVTHEDKYANFKSRASLWLTASYLLVSPFYLTELCAAFFVFKYPFYIPLHLLFSSPLFQGDSEQEGIFYIFCIYPRVQCHHHKL